MASYPVEIRRCQHIRVNGTQCGSPALRDEKFCYYHKQYRPQRVEFYGEDPDPMGAMNFPVFEDAHSIQAVVREVAQYLMQKRIEPKTAGLVLYAMQIASSNLRQMQAEKPRPTQVVVEPEKVAETPMGMTPWSASGEGHDPEDRGGAENGEWRERFMEQLRTQSARLTRISKWLKENPDSTYGKARGMLWAELRPWAQESIDYWDNYDLEELGDEVRPLEEMPAIARSAEEERLRIVVKAWEARTTDLAACIRGWLKQDLSMEELRKNFEGLADEAESELKETAERGDDDPRPPETIQACAEDLRQVM